MARPAALAAKVVFSTSHPTRPHCGSDGIASLRSVLLSSSFADLGVRAEAVNELCARGIVAPFPIQAAAIPAALDGKDICGKAPTGSGKTIAFGIPVAARVGRGRPGKPRALILAPTRELANQIHAEMSQLMGAERRRRVGVFYGGVGFGTQLKSLRQGVDVAVACPGRLKDLIGRRVISLAEVSIVVIDEADRMADMGFLPEVKSIVDQVRADRQTMLFSATLDGDVDELIRRYQRDPVRVSVDTDEDQSSTEHRFMDATREERVKLTAGIVGSHGRTIVFCRTQHGTDRVAKQLVAAGVDAVPIHGGRSQAQRELALERFSTGRAQALVATDVAARGIHVDHVGCVVHFDLPATAKDYLHRSGRTGRAGASGVVISFVGPADKAPARALQRAIGHPVETPQAEGRVKPKRQQVNGRPSSKTRTRRLPSSGDEPSRRPPRRNRSRTQATAAQGRRHEPDRAARPARPPKRRTHAA